MADSLEERVKLKPGQRKLIQIRDGVDDPQKLIILGKTMKTFINEGKKSDLVRRTAIGVLKNTGGHWAEPEHRHPVKIIDGKYWCMKCNELHPKSYKDHFQFAKLSDRPMLHKHNVWKKGVKPHDLFGEVEAIQKYVQGYDYRFDPCAVEYFQYPRKAIEDYNAGKEALDCDDLSMLTCALLGSIGYQTAVMVTNPKGYGSPYSHAMAAVKFPKTVKGIYGNIEVDYPGSRWIPLELTIKEKVGWVPEKADKFLFFKTE